MTVKSPAAIPASTGSIRVAVVGAGVIGASIAYHLARSGVEVALVAPSREVQAPTASWGSAGGVRQQNRDPREIGLTRRAASRWPTLSEELGGDTGFRQQGHLRVAETDEEVEVLLRDIDLDRSREIVVEWVDDKAAKSLAPGLAEHVLGGAFSPLDGHADPRATTHGFLLAAESAGASFVPAQATGLSVGSNRGCTLHWTNGQLEADVVVIAAGVWTRALLLSAGIDLALAPLSTQMVLTEARPFAPIPTVSAVGRNISLKQLISGQYFLGGGFRSKPNASLSRCDVLSSSVADAIATTAAVFPELEKLRIDTKWGAMDGVTPDRVPYVGFVPAVSSLFIAAGFSGHGFQLSPAVGEAASDLILGGNPDWARLDELSVERGIRPDSSVKAT